MKILGKGKACFPAVSYTHLDVYKRQGYGLNKDREKMKKHLEKN